MLHRAFPEEAIFRIDHFLGKDGIENLLVFRFANSLLEPVWNRQLRLQHPDHDGRGLRHRRARGKFYDTAGALRDVVQNHLLADRRPAGHGAAGGRPAPTRCGTRRSRSSARSPPLDPTRWCGASTAATSTSRASPRAPTPRPSSPSTFEIDSWRWAGVPWLIRAGKNAAGRGHRGDRDFHEPPRLLFVDPDGPAPQPNQLRFRLGPTDGVVLHLFAKEPGDRLISQAVDLAVDYEQVFGRRQEAYERLLEDAMEGDTRRFGRADTVDEQWRIVSRLIDDPAARRSSTSEGNLGPGRSAALAAPYGGWADPLPA